MRQIVGAFVLVCAFIFLVVASVIYSKHGGDWLVSVWVLTVIGIIIGGTLLQP